MIQKKSTDAPIFTFAIASKKSGMPDHDHAVNNTPSNRSTAMP